MSKDKEVRDIIDEILEDHRELEEYYAKYKASKSTEEAQKWFNLFVWEVSRHSVAEEIVLYPWMEARDERGIQMAKESREDHRRQKELLEDLRKETDPVKFDEKFDFLFKDLEEHLKKEEVEDLNYVKEQFTLHERKKASKSFSLRKKLAPTRPHPEIPDKPTALEVGLGLLVTPIDKLKDVFTAFPEEEK